MNFAIRRELGDAFLFLADPGKLLWSTASEPVQGAPGPPYWSSDPGIMIRFADKKSAKAVSVMWFSTTKVEVIEVDPE
jgi:hypothetical protein